MTRHGRDNSVMRGAQRNIHNILMSTTHLWAGTCSLRKWGFAHARAGHYFDGGYFLNISETALFACSSNFSRLL